MNDNSNPTELVTSPALWRDRSLELREEEWKAHQDCLDAARDALKRIRGRRSTPADIAKLLDLASKLGRLATGLAFDHTAHSTQDDRAVRVEISAAIKKIYCEPMESLLARINLVHKPADPANSPVALSNVTKSTDN